VEHAPLNKRGLYGSIPVFSCIAGFLLSSCVAMLLERLLSPDQIVHWGWRLPFLIGVFLGAVTLYIRLYMPETPYFLQLKKHNKLTNKPLQHALFFGLKKMCKGVVLSLLAFVSFGILFIYLPTYLNVYLHISFETALFTNTIGILTMLILTPFVGFLSDKVGRKPLLYIASIAFVVFSYPLFLLLSTASIFLLILIQIIFAVLVSFAYAPLMVALVELFPTRIRYTAVAVSFNIASALFGGTGPLIANALIPFTRNETAPCFYLILAGLVTLFLLPFIKESYKDPLI
jgi:MHS family proline/betaine transporter-like MFS transporter